MLLANSNSELLIPPSGFSNNTRRLQISGGNGILYTIGMCLVGTSARATVGTVMLVSISAVHSDIVAGRVIGGGGGSVVLKFIHGVGHFVIWDAAKKTSLAPLSEALRAPITAGCRGTISAILVGRLMMSLARTMKYLMAAYGCLTLGMRGVYSAY